MKAYNLKSHNGNFVPNQFVLVDNYGTITFQSYNSIIAEIKGDEIKLDCNYWDYSRTTLKYLAHFLNDNTKYSINGKSDILNCLKVNEEFKLADLNQ